MFDLVRPRKVLEDDIYKYNFEDLDKDVLTKIENHIINDPKYKHMQILYGIFIGFNSQSIGFIDWLWGIKKKYDIFIDLVKDDEFCKLFKGLFKYCDGRRFIDKMFELFKDVNQKAIFFPFHKGKLYYDSPMCFMLQYGKVNMYKYILEKYSDLIGDLDKIDYHDEELMRWCIYHPQSFDFIFSEKRAKIRNVVGFVSRIISCGSPVMFEYVCNRYYILDKIQPYFENGRFLGNVLTSYNFNPDMYKTYYYFCKKYGIKSDITQSGTHYILYSNIKHGESEKIKEVIEQYNKVNLLPNNILLIFMYLFSSEHMKLPDTTIIVELLYSYLKDKKIWVDYEIVKNILLKLKQQSKSDDYVYLLELFKKFIKNIFTKDDLIEDCDEEIKEIVKNKNTRYIDLIKRMCDDDELFDKLKVDRNQVSNIISNVMKLGVVQKIKCVGFVPDGYVTCPICCDTKSNIYSLICGGNSANKHFICAKCLENLYKNDSIICPFCRTQHNVSKSHLKELTCY